MKQSIKTLISLSLLCVALAISSCTKESITECSGVRLKFHYILNNQEVNLFGSDVQDVNAYIFNEQGVLIDIIRASGPQLTNDYTHPVSLPVGRYTLVVWGGSGEDMFGYEGSGSYKVTQMDDPVNHIYSEAIIGQTTLDNFRMMLTYGYDEDGAGDIIPQITEFDDLYYGMVKATIVEGLPQVINVPMIKNTNTLKVKISGLPEYLQRRVACPLSRVSGSPLQVWAMGRNGRYKWDNTIGEYARLLRYVPHTYPSSDDPTVMYADIKVQRLDLTKHIADPISLTVFDPTLDRTYANIDVVKAIIQAQDDKGNYLFDTQEKLDKEDRYPIEINIRPDFGIRIFIAGWEVIYLTPTSL